MNIKRAFSSKIYLFLGSMKKRGILNTLFIVLSYMVDYASDVINGTDTLSFVNVEDMGVEEALQKHAKMYQPTFGYPLRRVLTTLEIPAGKVFLDLGCGKGKALLVASEFNFKEVRGVEISALLCEIAKRNCSIYCNEGKVQAIFSIIHSDMAKYRIKDDEDVFFLFNPFDDFILKHVLYNIVSSLQKQKRKIWIIYRNAIHRETIDQILRPSSITELMFWGFDFVVFEKE